MRVIVCLCVFIIPGAPPASKPKPAPTLGDKPADVKPAPAVRELPSKDLPAKPLKVGDVIKSLGLDESKMSYCDEPPGKLRGLRWSKVRFPGTEAEVDVRVDIVYTLAVFSDTGEWDIKAVRAATVIKVTIASPGLAD